MTPFFRHVVLGAVVSSAVYLGASGCTDAVNDVYVVQVLSPQMGTTPGVCMFTADPGQPFFTDGVLDLKFRREYRATMLVASQIMSRASKTPLRAESSQVQLQGTEVSVENNKGDVIAGPFTVPGSGFIKEGNVGSPSYGLIESILIDSGTATKLENQLTAKGSQLTRVTAKVKAFGTTLGGTAVETSDFTFPIDVCLGCLVTYPIDANDPTSAVQPNCEGGSTGLATVTDCRQGQDTPIDCRICNIIRPGDAVCDPRHIGAGGTTDGGAPDAGGGG